MRRASLAQGGPWLGGEEGHHPSLSAQQVGETGSQVLSILSCALISCLLLLAGCNLGRPLLLCQAFAGSAAGQALSWQQASALLWSCSQEGARGARQPALALQDLRA